jgi:hypothetical protein
VHVSLWDGLTWHEFCATFGSYYVEPRNLERKEASRVARNASQGETRQTCAAATLRTSGRN